MPRRPRLTTQYRRSNREINLDTLKREAIRKEKASWPSREKMHLILEGFLPKDILKDHLREEWIWQLENALKTRNAQAFPVGSRRGLWLLETLNKLGFIVETGLSADKKWTLIQSIRTPAEIRKEQNEQALSRTVLKTAKPQKYTTINGKKIISRATRPTIIKKRAKPKVQEQKPAEIVEREEIKAPVARAKSQTSSEEAVQTLLGPLTEMVMENKWITNKKQYLTVAQGVLQGRRCLAIAFALRIPEKQVILIREKLLDHFVRVSKADRKFARLLLLTKFFDAYEYEAVSERFRSSCWKDVEKAQELKKRLE